MKKAIASNRRAASHGLDAMTMAATTPFAAMITLGHRVPMLLEAMGGSNAWADPEFMRMTTEKAQAAGQAAVAMGGAVAAGQQAVAGYALAQANANLAFLMRPSPTAADLQRHADHSLKRLTNLTAALGEIGSRSIATSLRPAHGKVTANAKRLGNRKRRRGG